IARLRYLRKLNLWGSKVSNIEPLRSLTRIERLNLGNTRITNTEPLRNLLRLRELNLSGTLISDIKPLIDLAERGYLIHVDLRLCTQIPKDQVEDLRKLGVKVYWP
ncbi:MAG: leucine-rich repeat domain-containing protein, partial [Candidatus Njordarchaeota archaeon]